MCSKAPVWLAADSVEQESNIYLVTLNKLALLYQFKRIINLPLFLRFIKEI